MKMVIANLENFPESSKKVLTVPRKTKLFRKKPQQYGKKLLDDDDNENFII